MSTEAVDILQSAISEMRAEMRADHKRLWDKVAENGEKVAKVSERVAKLEANQRIAMWLIAPACLALGSVAREIISGWFV